MATKQQTKLKDEWESRGWIVVNLIRTSKNGISDLMACKNGKTVFIESKERSDSEKPLQSYVRRQFLKQGFDWYINDQKLSLND
jgi:Holliday junction resolvase